MNNWIFVISSILIAVILIGLSFESLYNYGKWHVPLSKIYDVVFIDVHEAENNASDYSTMGNITIIDKDTIEITFNNENNFGLIRHGVKVWSIPESFEFIKTVKTGDKFITHCKEGEDDISVDIFELKSIDISNASVILYHYVGLLPKIIECKHPEIIKHSFDIDWKNIILLPAREKIILNN